MRVRAWVAERLLFAASRLSPETAFRRTGLSFTFERHRGIVVNQAGRGCPLWYYGMADYRRAHDEAERL